MAKDIYLCSMNRDKKACVKVLRQEDIFYIQRTGDKSRDKVIYRIDI